MSGYLFDVSYADDRYYSIVKMTSELSVHMCYKLASHENYMMVSENVVTVVAPVLNYILPNRIVGNVAHTIEFSGRFLGGDLLTGPVQAVFVRNSNCNEMVTLADGHTTTFNLVAIGEESYGAEIQFAPADLPALQVCLKYPGRDAFELQSGVTLEAVFVREVEPTFVRLHQRSFVAISTYGSKPMDTVKWVPVAAECSAEYPEYVVGNQQIANVKFTEKNIFEYVLCYRPVEEEYVRLAEFVMTVNDDRYVVDFASAMEHFTVPGRR